MGLDAFEHWLEVIPRQTIEAHLPQILPPLNDYLSKEWLEQRERVMLEGLSDEKSASRNRSAVIERLINQEQEKVEFSVN